MFAANSSAADGGSGIPLTNLSALGRRVDSLRHYLVVSLHRGSPVHLPLVSAELSSTLRHVITNAAALLANSSSNGPLPPPDQSTAEIVDLDGADLAADSSINPHTCEICGKSFKRDANLRMHMRAHGGRFKSPDSLRSNRTQPGSAESARFSCPVQGCVRNRRNPKFRPLKSAACAKTHYRRAHCPKTFTCGKCSKTFAVMGDLRNHEKSCGEESRWRCTCGTSFSRKDKLFGHVALFEGHAPAINVASEEKGKNVIASDGLGTHSEDFEELMDDFETIGRFYESWRPQ